MAKTVKRAAAPKAVSKAKPKPKAAAKPRADKLKSAKPKATKLKPAKALRKSAKIAAALPIPASIPAPEKLARPRALDAGATALAPFSVAGADAAILDLLWQTVEARRQSGDIATSHSARLLSRGTPKVAQKLGEEAVECVIEATLGNRAATVLESADLLYHLIVVWVDAGITPTEVWTELARRQGISGIAEKAARPKALVRAAQTTKLP
ncbi:MULTISPECIES: phosphoribosyl-ATP diphosphatase [Roseomonadaceae]|uniref:Phosphoribosyl-ATP pyrophosphatase n=1 Tax=Falsiroseomonas oleicola TaxID=2801474 RepID=A0ABS6H7P8_9PROT|nr:phosphoribosyl-ATP diphosphatase [Roseomonas oleicola]MBU8544726.1 phosphoribosyl-ATP diphosphatase [Roseomonas oleicola]